MKARKTTRSFREVHISLLSQRFVSDILPSLGLSRLDMISCIRTRELPFHSRCEKNESADKPEYPRWTRRLCRAAFAARNELQTTGAFSLRMAK